MSKLLIVVLALVLTACVEVQAPVRNESTDNPSVPVALLFEHDGCRVYRFIDADRYRYYADCRGSSSVSSHWSESCGKNCTRTVEDHTTTGYGE